MLNITAVHAQVRNALVSERERLFSKLKEISFLEPYPSHANFILAKVNLAAVVVCRLGIARVSCQLPLCPPPQVLEGRDAKALKEGLANRGIMVRHYAKKELSGFIRISVGKPEHTDALLQVLKTM